jgi:hypothetical protein
LSRGVTPLYNQGHSEGTPEESLPEMIGVMIHAHTAVVAELLTKYNISAPQKARSFEGILRMTG